MNPRRAGLRLSLYAVGGTVLGIFGFGTLWRGLAHGHAAAALAGVAMALAGTDRAARALAASMRARRSSGTGTPPA